MPSDTPLPRELGVPSSKPLAGGEGQNLPMNADGRGTGLTPGVLSLCLWAEPASLSGLLRTTDPRAPACLGCTDHWPTCWLSFRGIKLRLASFRQQVQLGGCGILGVGIWLAATQGNFATLSSSFPSLSAANLLIVTGTFVMAIGFVGCIGAIKENKCLLLTFFVLLLLVFLLEATVTVLFFAYTDKIDRYAQRDLKKGLHLYGTPGNVGLTNAWSIIQTDFRCCGVSNYTDWFEVYNATRVPDSCCLEFSESCGLHAPGTWWKAPCYETVKMWLQENLLAVGIFGLCTALVQEPGYTRGENPTAQPPGTNRLAGVLLRNRNSSEPGFVQRPPHPRRADRASMGSERPSPSAQPAGPQGREPSPAPTGLTAVGAGREGPESSGQPCQFGPSPHHW
uniref:Tetraspanin-4 n=1 Tax=Ursus maritimus TaxID=29073 RepID=A0A452THP7_URSMA